MPKSRYAILSGWEVFRVGSENATSPRARKHVQQTVECRRGEVLPPLRSRSAKYYLKRGMLAFRDTLPADAPAVFTSARPAGEPPTSTPAFLCGPTSGSIAISVS